MTARRIFWPALVVAIGAAAATAHGLYEVAVASRVPSGIAWLYPVITDGLALVAYAATRQLGAKAARGYAWFVVVVAAGLSGLAQAVLLASDDLVAPTAVRFGIGAWPAVAAAVVAHLLYLLAADDREQSGADVPAVPASPDLEPWPEPTDWWSNAPAAPQNEPDSHGEPAALVAVPDLDLETRVEAILEQAAARGEDPPGRRAIANQLGLKSDYPVRRILEARS